MADPNSYETTFGEQVAGVMQSGSRMADAVAIVLNTRGRVPSAGTSLPNPVPDPPAGILDPRKYTTT